MKKTTGIPSNVLGASLDLCGTTISILNFSTRSPTTRELLSVIIEELLVFRTGPENRVLHTTPSPRAKETVTGFLFTTKGVL